MVDPITAAVVATTVGAVNAGSSILQIKKQNELKKENKRIRTELAFLEGGIASIAVAAIVDARLVRKAMTNSQESIEAQIENLSLRIEQISQKVEQLNIDAVNAKLDMVVAATANPIIIPSEKLKPIITETKKEEKEDE